MKYNTKKLNIRFLKNCSRKPRYLENQACCTRIRRAGKLLADLHVNYAQVPPCPDVVVTGADKGNFHVEKMKFAGRQGAWDKSRIIYNADIEISSIPLRAYEYVVNGRSAIEWVMESYRIKVDKASGIKKRPQCLGSRTWQATLYP